MPVKAVAKKSLSKTKKTTKSSVKPKKVTARPATKKNTKKTSTTTAKRPAASVKVAKILENKKFQKCITDVSEEVLRSLLAVAKLQSLSTVRSVYGKRSLAQMTADVLLDKSRKEKGAYDPKKCATVLRKLSKHEIGLLAISMILRVIQGPLKEFASQSAEIRFTDGDVAQAACLFAAQPLAEKLLKMGVKL